MRKLFSRFTFRKPLLFLSVFALLLSAALTFFVQNRANYAYADSLCSTIIGDCKYVLMVADSSGKSIDMTNPLKPLADINKFYINVDTENHWIEFSTNEDMSGATSYEYSGDINNLTLYIYNGEKTVSCGTASNQCNTVSSIDINPITTYKIPNNTQKVVATRSGNSFTFSATNTSGEATEDTTNIDANAEAGDAAASSSADTKCSSAASGLGWVLCPVANLLSNTLSSFYGWMEQFLQINTGILMPVKDGQESGVHQAWRIFRDFANVFFVIYLLVMIFSQISGVGISNYGIKKNLPRVVVSAILINLSYYLCIIAVDASNIIGASIKSLFDNIAQGIDFSQTGIWTASNVAVATMTGIGGVSALVAIGVTGILAASEVGAAVVGILLGLLSVLVTAVIAVVGMFLALAVRQGLVAICVAVSPLAFILYTLPNTKNTFDKWWKLMKGLVLVYPICGFVIGAGTLASRIVLATGDDLWTVLISAVVQVGPYFALPAMIRGAFKAAGDLSSRVAKFTSGTNKLAHQGVGFATRRPQAFVNTRMRGVQQRRDAKLMGRHMRYLEEQRADLEEMNRANIFEAQEAGRNIRTQNAEDYIKSLADRGGISYAGKDLSTLDLSSLSLSDTEQLRLNQARDVISKDKTYRDQLKRKNDAQYWANQAATEERGQRELDERALMTGIQNSDRYATRPGQIGYEVMRDELKNILSQSNITEEEQRRASALTRVLLDSAHDDEVFKLIQNRGTANGFTNDGVKNFASIFMNNAQIASHLGTKAKTTAKYLESVAGDDTGAILSMTNEQIGAQFGSAFSDTAKALQQDKSEFRAYGGGLKPEQINHLLEDKAFTDEERSEILRSTPQYTSQQQAQENLNRQQTTQYMIDTEDAHLTDAIRQRNQRDPLDGLYAVPPYYTQVDTVPRPGSPNTVRIKDSQGNEKLFNRSNGRVESQRKITFKDANNAEHEVTGYDMVFGSRIHNGTDTGMMTSDAPVWISDTQVDFKYVNDRTNATETGHYNPKTGVYSY